MTLEVDAFLMDLRDVLQQHEITIANTQHPDYASRLNLRQKRTGKQIMLCLGRVLRPNFIEDRTWHSYNDLHAEVKAVSAVMRRHQAVVASIHPDHEPPQMTARIGAECIVSVCRGRVLSGPIITALFKRRHDGH